MPKQLPPPGWIEVMAGMNGPPTGDYSRTNHCFCQRLHKVHNVWMVDHHVIGNGLSDPYFTSHPVQTLRDAATLADVLLALNKGEPHDRAKTV
jgi:hypothetical protein